MHTSRIWFMEVDIGRYHPFLQSEDSLDKARES